MARVVWFVIAITTRSLVPSSTRSRAAVRLRSCVRRPSSCGPVLSFRASSIAHWCGHAQKFISWQTRAVDTPNPPHGYVLGEDHTQVRSGVALHLAPR